MKNNTISYYNNHAADFVNNTATVDIKVIQDRFLKYIPEQENILDFGCGSGRDSKYFLEKGYKVTMRNHLEEETGLNITSIDEWFYEEENKSVLLDIKLPLDFNPSLEDLDNIRVALNEYMQEDGGFLDDGWKVTIDIDRVTKGSEKPTRYALISNFSYGYMKDGGWDNLEVSDHLNTFFFSINLDDTYYISELDGIEHIKICGLYTEYNTNLIETTIAELSELEDLESVTVYPYWYQAFSESNLDCEIIVTEDTHSGDI